MASEIMEAVLRFFSPREAVRQHWHSPLDNFQCATSDFYQMIEKELIARKIPGLTMSRVEFSEGGVLSDKREYLKLQRERLCFLICAAPCGTSFFFSFRFIELPLGIKPAELLVFLVSLAIIFGLLAKLLGTILGCLSFIAILIGSIYVMRNAIALGLKDLDTTLLKIPILGVVYEKFIRKGTYYREDTRLIFQSIVNSITERAMAEVTAAQGIKLLSQFERKPVGGNAYEATIKRLGSADAPPPA